MRVINRLFRGDADLHEVVTLAAAGLLLRGSGVALSFGISVLIVRLLGAEGAGPYFFAFSAVNVASIFGRMGFGTVLVRYIAQSVVEKDWGKGRFVYNAGLKIVGFVSVVVALVVAVSAPWSAKAVFGKPEYEIPLILAGLAVFPYSLTWTEGDALRALRRIPSAQLVKSVLASFITLALLYPLAKLWQADGAVLGFLIGSIITALIGHRLWVREWSRIPGNTGESTTTALTVGSLVVSSWALLGVSFANLGIQNVASVLLGALGSNTDVSVFNVANRVASMLQLPLYGMTGILAPKFVQLHTSGNMAGLESLARRTFWILLALVLPAAIGVFAMAGPIMSIFGRHFENAVPILRILMIATVVNAATGPTGTMLIMCGRERSVWKLAMATLVAAVGLCIGAQLLYGVVGLSWMLVFSLVMENVVLVVLVKRHLGFWPIGPIKKRLQPSQ